MEPMLRSLELSLGGTKKRLKEEAKLRRTAEIAQVEAETRVQEMRDENEVVKEECEALRAELEHKVKENDQLKREHETSRRQLEGFAERLGSTIQQRREERTDGSFLRNVDSGVITEAASNKSQILTAATPGDESYAEVLDELETVTEQLITTQQKLWRTEDQLRESEAKAAYFESDIRKLKSKKKSRENDKGYERELEQIRAELARTKRELEESETDQTKRSFLEKQEMELEEQDDQIEIMRDQIEELEDSAKMAQEQINGLEALLEESQDENIRLVEEIASLRILLHDEVDTQVSQAFMKDSISKEVRSQVLKEANEVREKEINALREEFKRIFRENTALKEKMEKLENGFPSLAVGGDYLLQKEVDKLKLELHKAQAEHNQALLEVEASWKKKLEQVMTGDFIPEDLLEEMEEEMKTAIDSAADRVRRLQADKDALEARVDSLERELEFSDSKVSNSYNRLQDLEGHLKVSKDEILRLKKSNTHLTSELEYTTRIMSRMDAECERLTRQHSELKAELEVALQVIESNGMDHETVNTEETLKSKEKIHRLTSNLNKIKGDYSALLNELEATRGHFLDAQESAAKQKEAELKELTEKILELEEALQKATIDNTSLSKKLKDACKEQDDAMVGREHKARKLQEELETTKRNIVQLEKEIQESNPSLKLLQKELKQCKDALSSSRIENKRLEEEIEKLRAGTSMSSNRLSRDPDPVEETLNRDPPSITRNSNADDPQMPSLRLRELAVENELLKEKIARSDRVNVNGSFDGKSSQLYDQLLSKSKELQALEDAFFELKGVLRSTDQKMKEAEEAIERSEDEMLDLKTEVKTLKEALQDAHQIHSETAHQLELARTECKELRRSMRDGTALMMSATSPEELEKQIQRLKDEKTSLQHQVDDAKIALSLSEYAQERTKEELRASQAKHKKSQENVRTLKEELKKLAGAFSGLRNDHEALLGDIEVSRGNRESSSHADAKIDDELHMQLAQLVAENSDLLSFASDIEKKMQEYQNEIFRKSKENESLECNLLTTQEEARLLSEEITNLSTAFENAQAEYDAVVEELDAVQSLFEKSREATESVHKISAADVVQRKIKENEEQQKNSLASQLEKAFADNMELRKKLDETEKSLREALQLSEQRNDSVGFEKEIGILRLALQDSQNEVKALKERCFEIEILLKQTSKRADDEPFDHPINEQVLSAVFDSEEMQDLKEQFNALIEENINLEQVVRQSELALTLAKDVEETNKKENAQLERDISDLKSAKLKLQEEVYNLTVELENASEDHLTILAETKAAMQAEAHLKTQPLKYQIDALMIENASLRSKIQKFAESDSQNQKQANEELRKAKMDLQIAEAERHEAVKAKVKIAAKFCELEAALKLKSHEHMTERNNEKSDTVGRSLSLSTNEVHIKAELEATMEVFERIDSLLASVEFLERHHEINLRTSHANLASTSQKAEEIRRKIAFLTYAFQKEKKEHSDVVFQLKSAKSRLNDLEKQHDELKNLQEKHQQLLERLDVTEVVLQAAVDSEKRHQADLKIKTQQYQEMQKAASNFQRELLTLQGAIKDVKEDLSADGERSSRFTTESVQEDKVTFEDEMVYRINREKSELQTRLHETEAALAAARSMKLVYEGRLKQYESEDDEDIQANDPGGLELLSNNVESNPDTNQNHLTEALPFVKQQHGKSRKDEAKSADHEEIAPHAQAKIRLLESQFQKLNEQSSALLKQMQNAENAVTIVRDKQNCLKDVATTREKLTQMLQSQIVQNKQRNLELGEMTILMESRVNLTEETVEKLEHQLSSTKSSAEISRTEALVNQGRQTAARLEMLLKQRSDPTSKQPESSPMKEDRDSEDDEEASMIDETRAVPSKHDVAQGVRDDNDCVHTVSRGMRNSNVAASLNVWSVSLSNDIVSAVSMDAAQSPENPTMQDRSISPFTLSLISDNTNNIGVNDLFGAPAFPSESPTTPAHSQPSSNNINDEEVEEVEDATITEDRISPDVPSKFSETPPILEARSDCGTEQRE
jgi:chromosome segregation ATPase